MEKRDRAILAAIFAVGSAGVACAEGGSIAQRRDNMIATAQSVQAEGVQGLVNKGMSEKAIVSQRYIVTGWRYDLIKNGQTQTLDYQVPCDTTIMKAPEIGGYIMIGVTHCASTDHEVKEMQLEAEARNPGVAVSVTNMQMMNLHFDSEFLQRNQFGLSTWLDSNVQTSENGQDGISFYFIPNESLSEAERTFLDQTALEPGDLLLDEVPNGTEMSGYCNPAEISASQLMPAAVVMIGAHVNSQDENELFSGDALYGKGCSGSGEFATLTSGETKMVSVTVGSHFTNPQEYKIVGSYKLSALGLDGIRTQIAAAHQDYKDRNGIQ